MSELILPRLIRLRDAPRYLGMDPNRFNAEVRPYLVEIPIGKQGIAFDRLDLDAWVDQYKDRNGRPGKTERRKTMGRRSTARPLQPEGDVAYQQNYRRKKNLRKHWNGRPCGSGKVSSLRDRASSPYRVLWS